MRKSLFSGFSCIYIMRMIHTNVKPFLSAILRTWKNHSSRTEKSALHGKGKDGPDHRDGNAGVAFALTQTGFCDILMVFYSCGVVADCYVQYEIISFAENILRGYYTTFCRVSQSEQKAG
ncbi:MAG: hypothetical protein K2O70_04255 [Desulfovibrionaceae bacterium]|nr:hypothetical protein [Desulfovibrionaceae bacterium]